MKLHRVELAWTVWSKLGSGFELFHRLIDAPGFQKDRRVHPSKRRRDRVEKERGLDHRKRFGTVPRAGEDAHRLGPQGGRQNFSIPKDTNRRGVDLAASPWIEKRRRLVYTSRIVNRHHEVAQHAGGIGRRTRPLELPRLRHHRFGTARTQERSHGRCQLERVEVHTPLPRVDPRESLVGAEHLARKWPLERPARRRCLHLGRDLGGAVGPALCVPAQHHQGPVGTDSNFIAV